MECLEGLARAMPRRVVLVDVGWRAGAMRARWLRMMERFGGGTAVGWSGLGDWGADVEARLCVPGEDVRGLVGVEEARAGLVESERVILESGKEMHLEVLMWEEFGGVGERVLSEVVGNLKGASVRGGVGEDGVQSGSRAIECRRRAIEKDEMWQYRFELSFGMIVVVVVAVIASVIGVIAYYLGEAKWGKVAFAGWVVGGVLLVWAIMRFGEVVRDFVRALTLRRKNCFVDEIRLSVVSGVAIDEDKELSPEPEGPVADVGEDANLHLVWYFLLSDGSVVACTGRSEPRGVKRSERLPGAQERCVRLLGRNDGAVLDWEIRGIEVEYRNPSFECGRWFITYEAPWRREKFYEIIDAKDVPREMAEYLMGKAAGAGG